MNGRTSQVRRMILALAVLTAIAAAYSFGRRNPVSAPSHEGGKLAVKHILYYVDPMHPSYRSDKPGTAPDCGMALVPVYSDDAANATATVSALEAPDLGGTGTASPEEVRIDGATQRLLGIRLAPVENSAENRIVRVVGRVVPEDTRIYMVNSGTDGFIRNTYNDSVGMLVKKDQKLASCYAPEFVTAASGFLAASERVPGALAKEGARSIQNYTDRLRNLGMSDAQVKQVAESRQLPESIDIVAPVDGLILARYISPAQHFMRDAEFYRIADLSHVWVVAEVNEQEAPYLHPGSAAQVTLRDGQRQLTARITDSLPQSEADGGTVKVRLEVANPGLALRPDMLVDVELPVRMPAANTIPLDALIDSGERATVYVETGDGVFEAREVSTGWRFGDRVEILHGLHQGERVVASATFLVDSERRLKTPSNRPTTVSAQPATAHAQNYFSRTETAREGRNDID